MSTPQSFRVSGRGGLVFPHSRWYIEEKGGSGGAPVRTRERQGSPVMRQEKEKTVLTKQFLLEKGMETPRMIVGTTLFYLVVILLLVLLFLLVFRGMDRLKVVPFSISRPVFWVFCFPAGLVLFFFVKSLLEYRQNVKALERGDFRISLETLGEKLVQGSLPGSPGTKYVFSFTFRDTGRKSLWRTSERDFHAPENEVGAGFYFVRREDRVMNMILLPACRYEPDEELSAFLVEPEDAAPQHDESASSGVSSI